MTNWKAIWAVFAGGLVAAAFITKVAPAIPALRDQLGLTLVESGLIATMFNVMGMAIGMVAGMFCDRYGRKRLALFGLVTLAIGSALGALADGFALLLAARFLEGVGFIVVVVSAPALMAGSATNRGTAPRPWASGAPTCPRAEPLRCSRRRRSSPPGAGAASGRAGGGLGVGGRDLRPRRAALQPGQVSSMRLVVESLQQKGNLVMGLLFAFYVAQWTSVMIWLPTFLIDEYGASRRRPSPRR